MRIVHRALSAILVAQALAPTAHAVEVSFVLDDASRQACRWEWDGYYGEYLACDPPVAASLAPAAPHGTGGTLDVDTLGQFMRASLNLEAYALDGFGMPAWSGTLERASASTVKLANGASGPWPLLPPNSAAPTEPSTQLHIVSFSAQDTFSGTLELVFLGDDLTQWMLHFSFASIPGSGAPACPGDRLLLDADADGEVDSRDLSMGGNNAAFGPGVDQNGLSVADFCDRQQLLSRMCAGADFRNDEPQRRKPADCRLLRAHQINADCDPREYFGSAASFPAPRTCLGLAVVDDADGDGEPDRSDRCPTTAAGAQIDGDGCDAPGYCALQAVGTCKRADFRNDEPGVKRPRDCAKTSSVPRACEVSGLP